MRLIDEADVLDGIEQLMKSPWFNDDQKENPAAYRTRREAVEIVRDLCVRGAPTAVGRVPRLVRMREIDSGTGTGWIEIHYKAGDIEGEPEHKDLTPCAWCYGTVILLGNDGVCDRVAFRRHYNCLYGVRIWIGKPSDELRERTKWTGRQP